MTARILNHFHAAARLVCAHSINWVVNTDTSEVLPENSGTIFHDSYAQVESLRMHNSRGGLKPVGSTHDGITWDDDSMDRDSTKRPSPLTIRLSERQKQIIRTKAQAAAISINRFVLSAALGSDYKPPIDPELVRALLRVYRELNAQGNNLNQIARQLNAGLTLPGQAAMLDALATSIQETLRRLQTALAEGRRA
jgi:Bacterial mobilisation protein (MobC)